MSRPVTIDAYHAAHEPHDRAVMERLHTILDAALPEAESKLWHAHPVWFLDGNPIAGYSGVKHGVRLMFWSGQSFGAPGLEANGKFKAATKLYRSEADIDEAELAAWLDEAPKVQWDYKNIVKRRGQLERLC